KLICKVSPIDVIKHVIDNSIDYDVPDRRKLKPMHIACKFANPEIIIYLANKGVDVESEDNNNERPLGHILNHKTPEQYKTIINDFLNLGLNVNYSNKAGFMPVHYVINNGDVETLKLLIE